MSSNNPESQGQDWPIYPGSSEPVEERSSEPPAQFSEPVEERRTSEPPYRTSSSEPVEERKTSEPVEERYAQDDAYKAYQSYAYQQPTDHHRLTHPDPVEGHPSRPRPSRPSPSSALQKKYVWIALGIVAALVITSIARGGFNLWPLIIFGAIAWWVVGNKRKC